MSIQEPITYNCHYVCLQYWFMYILSQTHTLTHLAPSLPALFSSKCLPSESDVECYRVCQLLTILRNLSFTDKCALSLSRHEGLLRFLLLCINNIVPDVRSLSLDLLTNLAPHILLNSHSSLVELLMASVNYCILSRDKLQILRGVCVCSMTTKFYSLFARLQDGWR